MKTSENKFEQTWKDVFEEAEFKPNENVWMRIDSNLANKQVSRYKRKLLIYKLLAAAAVVLAMGLGYFSFQKHNPALSSGQEIAGAGENTASSQSSREVGTENPEGRMASRQSAATSLPDVNKASPMEEKRNITGPGNNIVFIAPSDERKVTGKIFPGTGNFVDRSVSTPGVTGDKAPVPISRRSLALQENYPSAESEPARKTDPFSNPLFLDDQPGSGSDDENLWAGLNVASGIFNPNISYGPRSGFLGDRLNFLSRGNADAELAPAAYADLSDYSRSASPERTEYQASFSYAYGMNFGYRISKRFMVAGGLSYLYNNSSTHVSSYVENTFSNQKSPNQVTLAEKSGSGIDSYNALAEDIKVNVTYEFVSIPVKLGYILVDKKIKWAVTGGVSSDFYLKTKIYDNDHFFNATESSGGGDSPYKGTYFNALLGTMLNCRVAENYRISIEPAYRIGVNYLTREEAQFNARPSSFLVTAGMAYIFK